jgi:hypothetical protein
MVRRIIRFGRDDKGNEGTMRVLTIIFHPDPEARKAAAATEGFLWDEDRKQPIVDYHHGGEVSDLTASALTRAGLPFGTT